MYGLFFVTLAFSVFLFFIRLNKFDCMNLLYAEFMNFLLIPVIIYIKLVSKLCFEIIL